ncbi:TMEM165/GDT1 family protein [Leptolyngbya sp. FACHB-321]|uniref:TMEM165/GDT1 family protein n=1 Tax=Leptolyngbya sp. FACHB-321 TaxID=2692807 RepID=UPI0016831C5F|nr:TMEM165/GDT1 family protein [Leptolyngbya sp. FACHB-321]MBD2037823.1 TMEM165/GDT1 family protein [Leptolyngbya sp. FACHB-321]
MLAAFTAGLLLITISELGDKTFFIAMLLAMRHSRRLVFVGSIAALATMTILSVLLGQAVALLPKTLVHIAEVVLFISFGMKLLYDATQMPSTAICDEVKEAEETIQHADTVAAKHGARRSIVLQAFVLTFVGEWGDRTQFATIALAAANDPWGVTAGAIVGHAICAAIAVMGGRLIAAHISEKLITGLGGLLFLVFGVAAWMEGA